MSWDSTAKTVRYLADCTREFDGDFFHVHSIGGYNCKCGATHNLWDGPASFCERCKGLIITCHDFGPPRHDNPDFGPSLQTIHDAITFKRYTSLPA